MAAFALSDAIQYLKDRGFEDSSTRAGRVYLKIANEANKRLHMLGKFDFDKRYADLSFAGVYSTGTVSVAAGATAVTGSGTTWTAAMTGRYLRMNGESLQYKVTYSSPTAFTIPAYAGESNLSAVTYQLTDDRQALPANFRDFAWPLTDNRAVPKLFPRALELIKMWRRLFQMAQYPWFYAVEVEDVSNVPTPYMNIWPSLSEKRVITIPYYKWPADLAADADKFDIPTEAEPVLQLFLNALLARESKDGEWGNLLAEAEKEGRKALAAFRYSSEDLQRESWSPYSDRPDFDLFRTFPGFAPGETFGA